MKERTEEQTEAMLQDTKPKKKYTCMACKHVWTEDQIRDDAGRKSCGDDFCQGTVRES